MSEQNPPTKATRAAALPASAAMTPFDIGLFVLCVLVWGLAWIATHFQVGTVAPEVSIAWRYLIATPMMFAFAAWRGERIWFVPIEHLYSCGLGIALFSANYVLFYYASLHVSSGLLSILFTLAAIGNVVFAAIFFGVRIDRRVVAGGILGIAGVAAMFYPELGDMRFDGGALLGLVLGSVATVLFCLGNMVSISAQRRRMPVFSTTAWGMAYGTAIVAILAVARGETFTVDTQAAYLYGLAYLSVFGSFVGFGAYFTLLGRVGAARAGYSVVLYPVIALVASTFFEGYRWSALAVAGLVSVLLGVLLVLRRPQS